MRTLAQKVERLGSFASVYFGGGSPALCDLQPVLSALRPHLADDCEFTVELHPLDVTERLMDDLRAFGVNRISMGVQSLDDPTLEAMGRGYAAAEARRAFETVRRHFDNAGIDLIVGYPKDPCTGWESLSDWGLRHCSVYSLQNERGLSGVPDDDFVLDRIRAVAATLKSFGLDRYEISNYALPGFECRHNLAVWRGEDYLGLGDGAYGRIGLTRTPSGETLTPEADLKERTLFRLRTREGLDASRLPGWRTASDGRASAVERALGKFVSEGLLLRDGSVYRLTDRGMEVCDSIMTELV